MNTPAIATIGLIVPPIVSPICPVSVKSTRLPHCVNTNGAKHPIIISSIENPARIYDNRFKDLTDIL
jgi:hypothetical protein